MHDVKIIADWHWRAGHGLKAVCSCDWRSPWKPTLYDAEDAAQGHLTVMAHAEREASADG